MSTREIRLNRKDGSDVPLEMNAVTLPDGTVYGSCRDITERKKNEEGQRIAAVTFDTQEAIMITTPDAKILRVNQAFQEITGYSKDDVIGHNPRIFPVRPARCRFLPGHVVCICSVPANGLARSGTGARTAASIRR